MKRKLFPFFAAVIVGEIAGIALIILLLIYTTPVQTVINTVSNNIIQDDPDKLFLKKRLSQNFDIVADVYINNTSRIKVKETLIYDTLQKNMFIYLPFINNADYSIDKLLVDDLNVKYSIIGTCLFPKFTGKVSKIYIEYTVNLTKSRGILSYNSGNYYLGSLFCVKGVYKAGEPLITYKSSFGDPFIYSAAKYNICVFGDEKFKVFTPAEKGILPNGCKSLYNFKTDLVRDLPLVVSPILKQHNTYYKGIRINYVEASSVKNYTEKAVDFMENAIGGYPYKNLYVVSAPLSQSGMEFSGMIFLSDELFKASKELDVITYHEIIHQWFYGIVGTDQWNEPFLDEGIADFLAVYIKGSLNNLPSQPADPSFYKKKLPDYPAKDKYYSSAYKSSASFYKNLYEQMGNRLFEMLKKIYNDKKYMFLYYKELKNYINQFK
jgi:hypothetical protein